MHPFYRLTASLTKRIKFKIDNLKVNDQLKSLHYQPYKLKPKPQVKPIKAHTLIYDTFAFIYQNYAILLTITFFYFVAFFSFAYFRPNIDFSNLLSSATDTISDPSAATATKAKLNAVVHTIFNYRTGADTSLKWLQLIIGIFFSVIMIATIRRLHSNSSSEFRARDMLYEGTAKLIPFTLILSLIALEFYPFGLAGSLYNQARIHNLLINNFEIYSGAIIVGIIGLISLFFIPSAIIALYTVTIPGVYPMVALTGARKLVSGKRGYIVRSFLVLILFLFILYISLFFVILTFVPIITAFTIDIYIILATLFTHVFFFKLYRYLMSL